MKYLYIFISILFIASCGKEKVVPEQTLEEDGGVYFEKTTNNLFSGVSVKFKDGYLFTKNYYLNGQKYLYERYDRLGKIKTKGEYFNNKPEGEWFYFSNVVLVNVHLVVVVVLKLATDVVFVLCSSPPPA